jgi:spermidine/putrescine transport system ATP-binding protein
MAEFAVELKNVSKRFAGPGGETVLAVNSVSLNIRHGEFFSILGPSGCGKTTTLRMIGGFEMPSEGKVCIDSQEQGFTPPYSRPVNTVFQNYALFPHMTVYDNVAFGLQMQKVPREDIRRRVAEALDLVQMSGMEKRKPAQMSGGQQQRVALARALVNHPKVLLLDEPLGALDFKLRKAMQLELKALQHRVGITFVYVTHDQEEALTMSDRIGVMNRGWLLQVGTAQQIYESPRSRFVSDFIGETNYLEGHVAGIRDYVIEGEHRLPVVEVVAAPDNRLLALGVGEFQPGQVVTLAFRPEKVSIVTSAGSEQANQFSGTVAEVVYMGSATAYHIRLSNGAVVVARQQNLDAHFDTVFHPGDPITITWPLFSCKVFAEETGS